MPFLSNKSVDKRREWLQEKKRLWGGDCWQCAVLISFAGGVISRRTLAWLRQSPLQWHQKQPPALSPCTPDVSEVLMITYENSTVWQGEQLGVDLFATQKSNPGDVRTRLLKTTNLPNCVGIHSSDRGVCFIWTFLSRENASGTGIFIICHDSDYLDPMLVLQLHALEKPPPSLKSLSF